MISRLFVYGSLLRSAQGRLHPLLDDHANYLAEGFLYGKLFEVEGYPGVVLSAEPPLSKVYGELYALLRPSWLLQQLDEYEECSPDFSLPHEYRRCQQRVARVEGGHVNAWVYVYNRPTSGLAQISGGDYRQFTR